MAMKLNELLVLGRSSQYAHAGDPGAILPRIYGDFSSADAVSSDRESGGLLPATSINILDWTYCLNDGPSAEVSDIYVEDVRQSSSVYTVNLANPYEGGRAITTVTFNTDPGGRQISWRGKGFVDGAGVLIDNPLAALRSHLGNAGANPWDRDYFDPPSYNRALVLANTNQYPIHWCFSEDMTVKQLLTEVLAHYHGDFIQTVNGEVAVFLDQLVGVSPDRLLRDLDVAADGAGEIPEDEAEWDLDSANVVNELTIDYQYSWSRGAYMASITLRDEASIAVYQTVRTRKIQLPGVRTLGHLTSWVNLFFDRYALLPATFRVQTRTLRAVPLLPSTYATVSWRYGPDADGLGWSNRMVKVLNQTVGFEARTVGLQTFDTNLDWLPASYVILTDAAVQTWYLSVDDTGAWVLQAANPGIEAENIEPGWAWIALDSPDATTYYVQPATATTWTVSTNQPSGSGTSDPVLVTSKNSQRWRLQITDAQEVFFLAEPRRVAFGGFSWLTAVYGRGRFDVHVFG